MGKKAALFLVLVCASITMMILTSYGIISSDNFRQVKILAGYNETANTPRLKPSARVDNITEMWIQQKLRLDRIKTVCKHLNRTSSFTVPINFTTRILVNDHDHVLFGFIPKVGCKTWKQLFSEAKMAYGERVGFILSEFTDKERVQKLGTYKKVLFVRDPIVRFLSAYLSKFRNLRRLQKFWEQMYGFEILRLYRYGSEELLQTAMALPISKRPFLNITLTEFIRFITDLGNDYDLNFISDHWLPQHIVSHACEIPYDFVGKYENLGSEAPFVLKWSGMTSVVKFPEVYESTAAKNLAHEYSNVPLGLIISLKKYYSLDFELFGYDSTKSIESITRDLFNNNI